MNTLKKVTAIAVSIGAISTMMMGCQKENPAPTIAPIETTIPVVETESAPVETTTETTPVEQVSIANDIKAVLMDAYPNGYLMPMEMDADILEAVYGITSDMYTDFVGFTAMISAHVDTAVMVKANDPELALAKFNEYKDILMSDSFQYPVNLPKIASAQVHDFGNGWVGFFIMGGYADNDMEFASDDEAVKFYAELTQLGIGRIAKYFDDGIVPEILTIDVIPEDEAAPTVIVPAEPGMDSAENNIEPDDSTVNTEVQYEEGDIVPPTQPAN